MDVKGNRVDVKGNSVDVKGNSVDVGPDRAPDGVDDANRRTFARVTEGLPEWPKNRQSDRTFAIVTECVPVARSVTRSHVRSCLVAFGHSDSHSVVR
eukprot:8268768-Pyramimonas_sp.AAC.1